VRTKWTQIKNNYELKDRAIVTRQLLTPKRLDVTIGLPGWGLQNKTLAFMPLPKNIIEAPENWKSEYRGDELPDKNGMFIVQLQKDKLEISSLYFSTEKKCWFAVPEGWEVIGWMDYPKPFKNVI
jgi:hypothetical protein